MLKSSLVYLLSSLINKALPFVLLPVLTAYLSPSAFGKVSIFQVMLQFGLALSGFCLHMNISKNFFTQENSYVRELICNLIYVLSFGCLLLFVFIIFLDLVINETAGLGSWVYTLPALSFMGMISLFNLTLLRTREKPWAYLFFEVGQSFLNLCLVLILVVVLPLSWEGQVLAVSIAIMVFGFFSVISIFRQGYLIYAPSLKVIGDILKLSLPLIPHALAGVVISVSDRFFLDRMVGADSVGVYSVGYYFGMVVMLFSDAFIKAWSPWFFKKMAGARGGRLLVVRYTYFYIAALSVGAFIYSEVAVFVLPYVVSSEYVGAVEFIPWVCLAYVFFGVYQIFFPYYVYLGKTTFVASATVTAACVNLLGNYYLIETFGAVGAAYSTVLAFIVSAILVTLYAVGRVKMPWLLKRSGKC